MIGSFFSGLSGLRSNQTKLEVIGSNIANANTIGFKAARVQFSDVLARTVQAATRAEAPVQIGRGTRVTAITTQMTQGGLQESNVDTDVAIQGRGFFVVSDGSEEFYTRAGNFAISGDNTLTTQEGLTVQGFNAIAGVIPVSAVPEAIEFPTQPLPARATTSVGFSGNLGAGTNVVAVDADGNPARIGGLDGIIGTTLGGSVSISDDGTTVSVVGSGTTFTGLNPGDTVIIEGRQYTIDAVTDDTNMTLTRPTLSGTIEVASGSNSVIGTDTLFVSELRVGDTVNVDGQDVRVTAIQSDTELSVSAPTANEVTAGSPLEFGQAAGIRAASGETAETPTAPAASTRLSDLPSNFPIGRLETVNVLVEDLANGTMVVVSVDGGQTLGDLEDTVRQSGMSGYTLNDPQFKLSKLDSENGTATSVQLIDSQGNSHVGIMTAFRTEAPNTWAWRMEIPDAEQFAQEASADLVSNTHGTLTFDADGSILSFQNLLGAEQFGISARVSDAEALNVQMERDVFGRVTQYNLPSDLLVAENNGSPPGTLQSFVLDTNGVLTGNFSNGESQVLAQLLLADFANAQGLNREGSSLFASTVSSGGAIYGTPSSGNFGLTVSGSLELANVDLAEEFIDMILAQRGLQSSANVITTGDQIMNDLLVLKR